jgi:Vitamin K-dependent gamma-carboxylase
MNPPFGRMVAGWQRFWFEPQETSTLALFRIAFGLVALGWTATQGPNLAAFYGPHGVLPHQIPDGPGTWGILSAWHGQAAVDVLYVVTVIAAVALTLGLFSRFAALLVWIGIVSFEHRNFLVSNSGDGLVRNLAFFCALSPSGESLSVDRFLKNRERFWEFPARAPWALRLIQLQVSIGYLTAVWDKAGNSLWRNGTAVSYSLRIQDIHRFTTPGFITHSVVVSELFTYGTLVVELSLAILIWNRAMRPWVILAGVLLHLSIDVWVLVGFFSYAIFCGYVAFTPPETASRWILATRDRAQRIRYRGLTIEPRRQGTKPYAEVD